MHACEKYRGCDCAFRLRSGLRTRAKGGARRGRACGREGRTRSCRTYWPTGTAGASRRGRSSWTAGASGRTGSSLAARRSRKRAAGGAFQLPGGSLQRGVQRGRGTCNSLLWCAQRCCHRGQRKNGHLSKRCGQQSSRTRVRETSAIICLGHDAMAIIGGTQRFL